MISLQEFFYYAGATTVCCPLLLLAFIGLLPLLGVTLSERAMSRATQLCVWVGAMAAISIVAVMWSNDIFKVPLDVGNWVNIPEEHFHLDLDHH